MRKGRDAGGAGGVTQNPLLALARFGQSVWLDFLSRALLVSGELVSLIQEDGVTGVTSNPAAFERAIAGSAVYDEAIAGLARRGVSAQGIYETLAADDVRVAADLLRPVYDRLDGRDGFVSLEVSPRLARDGAGTLLEARRLWARVDRPNLLIKVPGTPEGIAATRRLIGEGINVDVTPLSGIPRYRAAAEAYLDGLSERAARGLPLERVTSVAGFFLSRIDLLVDPLLTELARTEGSAGQAAASLLGETAIACAKVARKTYRETLSDDRYLALAARGARPQRLLWAGTGTKDPTCRDLKYLEELIGPDTVTTVPLETLAAYRDHGRPQPRLEQGRQQAVRVLDRLGELGVDLKAVTRQLEDQIVGPFDSLMRAIELKRAAALG